MILTDLCEELRNWFDVDRHFGEFTIENGTLQSDFLREDQCYRIVGSIFNDGVLCYKNEKLNWVLGTDNNSRFMFEPITHDEIFKGAVWELAFPNNFMVFYKTMCDWENDNRKIIDSPYTSESFGGYSYSLGLSGGKGVTWKTHFADELQRWQKV